MTNWHPSAYALLLAASGLLAALAAVHVWRQRTALGGAAALALLGMAFWSFGYGVALGVHDLPARIFWAKVQYIGISLLAVGGPIFALRYAGLTRWLTPWTRLLLVLAPAIGLVLAWTNELHGLIWVAISLSVDDGLALLTIDYGPYFYFYAAYNYTLVLVTALIFGAAAVRATGLRRRQALIVLAGSALPAVAIALQLTGLTPLPHLDLLPFGYSLAALVVTFGLLRFRLFDVVPVARARVLEEMSDAVLVLDPQQRLLDYNPAAAALCAGLGVGKGAVGRRLPPALLAIIPAVGAVNWRTAQATDEREYRIVTSALQNDAGADVGRVVTFHDVTELMAVQRALAAAEIQANEQRRTLAVLEERARLGRDLHDGLGQEVAYIHVQAQSVRTLLDQGQHAAADVALRQLEDAAATANADLRAYLLGVRSARSEDGAAHFFAALEHYLADYAAAGALHVTLTVDPALDQVAPFTPEVAMQALYIIQEALTNARKHAGVELVELGFAAEGDYAAITIRDSGRGFDLAAAPTAAHYGLAVMRERAQSVGGALHVDAAPGQGVQITLTLPLGMAATRPDAGGGAQLEGLRVLLADDHPLFLDGLRTLLTARGAQVVGLAHDGFEAQRLAVEVQPALILMDVHMPHCDGIEAARRIHLAAPGIKIVMLTLAADEQTLYQALTAGATGYLHKSLDSLAFVRALAEIVRGEVSLTPDLAAQLLAVFPPPPTAAATVLTEQQARVLELVAQGLLYKEVARTLAISEATVKYHMGQIVEHLHVKNRSEAVAVARQRGLVRGEPG